MKEDYINIFEVFTKKLTNWINELIDKTPNIIIATVLFILGFYLSGVVKKLVVKLLEKRKVKLSARMMIGNIISIITVSAFLMFALNVLSLDNMLKTVLAGAGVAGLAIGLALQGTLSNTFSGVALSFVKDLSIGDTIDSNGYTGVIQDINLRVVKLKTPDGNLVMIPNRAIIENPLKNYSRNPITIVAVNCGIEYGANLENVQNVVVDAVASHDDNLRKEDIIFFYKEFGDSSIDFEVRFPIPSRNLVETAVAKSKAIVAIKKSLDQHNISIPFPIRTLDFPFDLLQNNKEK
ncbi:MULTISPECIES: mechanosensitive ion channel family protein [Chryseobacterium]|uniref:Small-conductance mechanosensitive channel n=1 Tax=Chryseobacterium taihuense TaxID=1141221 RepID=A0A4U8WEP7_9FLAO|nr:MULTISPECIES: mechanosensitive ion channel family protein [Chryseobacterium]QQV02067.1 mechanosensitive ion channel family protein [Chryseobacterium sp. FDAARGOS 1104]VFB04703.1 Small-conductance mechanosensitive channel [Chryseobacterium taihuense]